MAQNISGAGLKKCKPDILVSLLIITGDTHWFPGMKEIDDKRVTNNTQGESQNASPKQRKQSVYTPPTMKGVKHLKGQNESAFPEEEEGVNEREEQWDH
ncbi:protein phosphatase 1 regulatory subunit 1C isoform X2 [Ictidomys tridecemlineatus]